MNMGFFLVLSIFIASCTSVQNSVATSDHYDGYCFQNQNRLVHGKKSLFQVLKWKLSKNEEKDFVEPTANPVEPRLPQVIHPDEVFVTFINHATVLIQFQDLTILTDPVFSDYIGPFSLLSCNRFQDPGMSLERIPKIDLVLISHNHYDHLDLPSIRQIQKRDHPLFVVPLKNGTLLKEAGVEKCIELDWWESYLFNPKHKISLTPAQHWSARGLFDANRALWGGFVLENDFIKLFFAGDTGYASHFREIFQRFGAMDVALLPIGCYQPRWFMQEAHMDPAEAVTAHLDLQSSMSIGIHFGTFKLADEGVMKPATQLIQVLNQNKIPLSRFIAPQNGQTIFYKKG